MDTSDAAPFRSMKMSRNRMPSVVPLQQIFETIDCKDEKVNPDLTFSVSEERRGLAPYIVVAKYNYQATLKTSNRSTPFSSSISSYCPWRVSKLPWVPIGIPLEPTALEVRGISSTQITSRICAFMKLNSICCAYHEKEARADCQTICGLKFVVQLFGKVDEQQQQQDVEKHLETPGQSTTISSTSAPTFHAIIMEVQRRKGCCIVMRFVRTMMFKAVLKNNVASAKKAGEECSKRQRFCLQGLSRSRNATSTFDNTKPRCLGLLASKRKDCNRLGMDLLLVLANPNRVGREKAEEIAQALAFGTGPLGRKLRMVLISVIDRSQQRLGGRDDDDGLDVHNVFSLECPYSSDSDGQHLRLLVVQILSACLETILEKEQDYLCNEAILLDLGSKFWSRAVSFSLLLLDGCTKRQHEAALAAKCLRILESLHPGVLIPMTNHQVVSTVLMAFKVGRKHHLLLELESEKLLKCLNLMANVSDSITEGF
jgi:hypothetical protein